MPVDDTLVKGYERYSIGYVDAREQWATTIVASAVDLARPSTQAINQRGGFRWRSLDDTVIDVPSLSVPVEPVQEMPISDGKRRLDLDGNVDVPAPLPVGRDLDL